MHFYGFRGIVYNWFENYLTGRRQYVEIEESRSNIYQIECGVPQGSILGPLLYLIYVNDIAMSTTANILSFADDTSLYLSNSDERELYVSANSAIKSLYEWFCANKLASTECLENKIYNNTSTSYSMPRCKLRHSYWQYCIRKNRISLT